MRKLQLLYRMLLPPPSKLELLLCSSLLQVGATSLLLPPSSWSYFSAPPSFKLELLLCSSLLQVGATSLLLPPSSWSYFSAPPSFKLECKKLRTNTGSYMAPANVANAADFVVLDIADTKARNTRSGIVKSNHMQLLFTLPVFIDNLIIYIASITLPYLRDIYNS
ncbi:hypothetical protein H6P81_002604 [Aristolochia fimbriata]|uniref:Uncharacterized protein n=1 Tax=Aristolochia fimbriata TaxID=158543 RepID=A0AAV7FDE9_ARIFI|nr:hypothetical protein H6P81_002604 [Aristolochia fimbriata]